MAASLDYNGAAQELAAAVAADEYCDAVAVDLRGLESEFARYGLDFDKLRAGGEMFQMFRLHYVSKSRQIDAMTPSGQGRFCSHLLTSGKAYYSGR